MRRINFVTLLALAAVVFGVLSEYIDLLPPGLRPYIIVGGAIVAALSKELVRLNRRHLLLLAVPVFAFAFTASICDKAATGAHVGAAAISTLAAEKRDMGTAGEITRESELEYTRVLIDANNALSEFTNRVLEQDVIDAKARSELRAFLRQSITAFDNLNNAGTLHIKNAERQKSVRRHIRRARLAMEIYDTVFPDARGSPGKGGGERLPPEVRRKFELARERLRANKDSLNEDLARLEG